MTPLAYRFVDADAWAAAEASLDLASVSAVDDIGIAHDEAGTPLPGYHVNIAWQGDASEALDAMRIPGADAPRWWAGLPREAPEPLLEPVPVQVSLKQLLFALVRGGWITPNEALAAARTGELPGSLAAMIPGMTEEQAFAMRLTWAAMYTAERASPMWGLFIAAGVATTEQIDGLFRDAAREP